MATIYKEIHLKADPQAVWDAIRDFGSVHTRLARDFVTHTTREDGVRTVTFANGVVARERLVGTDDRTRRLAYTVLDGAAAHHNASFQVFDAPDGGTRLVWITDVLPDDVRAVIAPMVDEGSKAIQRTLEQAADRD